MSTDKRDRLAQIRVAVMGIIAIGAIFCLAVSPAFAASMFDDRDKGAGALDADSYITAVYPGDWNKPSRVAVQPLPSVAPQVFTIQNEDGSVTYYVKGASSLTARDNDTSIVITVDKEGNIKERIGGMPYKNKDYEGNTTENYTRTAGSGRVTITNEFGENLGFQEYGLKKQKLRDYDEKGNLTSTSHWDGRRLNWIIDELTGTVTQYDENTGNALYDIDYWGAVIATYQYDGNNLLYKEDLYNNRTYYKERGNKADYTIDSNNNKTATYYYDGKGRLESIVDNFGNRTLYTKNRPTVDINRWGTITKIYNWKGTKLISTTDALTDDITEYSFGRPTKTYRNGNIIKEWTYADSAQKISFTYIDPITGLERTDEISYAAGALLSIKDEITSIITYYDHGREFVGYFFD